MRTIEDIYPQRDIVQINTNQNTSLHAFIKSTKVKKEST